jgi:hypothetical protein
MYDLQKPTILNDVLDKMPGKDGLHLAYILPGAKGEKKMVAKYVLLSCLCTLNANVPLYSSYMINSQVHVFDVVL